MEFQYGKDKKLFLEENKFSFLLDTPEPGLFTLKTGTVAITSLPAVPGEFPETMALDKKRRPHLSADGTECSVESVSSIPFGAEPEISREYTFLDGRMTVRTDLVLRHSFEMMSISAGGFRAEGLKHIKISRNPSEAGTPAHDKTIDFQSLDEGAVIYDEAQSPLILRMVGLDNKAVDFELGASAWRWNLPARLQEGSARFTIRKENNGLVFTWLLFNWKASESEAKPPHGRTLRYFWALRYAAPQTSRKASKAVFDATAYDWPESARVHEKDGSAAALPCFQSAKTLEILKQWLRSQLADAQDGDVFALLVPEQDSVCFSATHEDRGNKEFLVHWDREGKMEFLRWANRQLAPLGAKLVIQTKKA